VSDTLSAIMSAGGRARTHAALFVGLSGDAPSAAAARVSLEGIDRVDVGRGKRATMRRDVDGARVVAVMLDDPRLSTQHARITRLGNTWIAEDLDSKTGTWIRGAKITRKQVRDGDVIVVGHTALVFREHGGEAGDLDVPHATGELVTMSPTLAARFAELARVATTNVPIELVGEPGTGALVARAVHAMSGRAGRFVTDAQHARDADRGTLFLDDVAEASQAELVRVLRDVDARIVTATQTSLDEHPELHADLRAHLRGVSIALPPLRDRREDLGLIIAKLLPRPVTFAADAVAALYAYDWPLNLGELERVLATATATGDRIELAHLPPELRTSNRELSPDDRELKSRLIAAIERNTGNLAAVARELGKDRTQIRRWMKRFGLSRDD
jgi:transcriptional regulator of acetoin/glycerol metabolism